MKVPYLKNKPKVIPIDLGRQPCVDDFLIEKTTLERTLHQVKEFEGNPIFEAEKKWRRIRVTLSIMARHLVGRLVANAWRIARCSHNACF